jgi:hypothetical protein
MTDHINLVRQGDTLDDARIELITDYLMGSLDPAQVEAVKLRLETDAEFRDYCAPIILAWSVPPKHEREPMSRAELARHWNNFTKRAGFIHQKRKARRRRFTILGLVLFAIGVSGFALKDQVRAAYKSWTEYHALPYADGWVPFGEGRDVQFAREARVRVANKESSNGVLAVRLSGTARFRTRTTDSATISPFHMIIVETSAGYAMAGIGEFTVRALADTMDVEVHHPTERQFIGFVPLPGSALVGAASEPSPLKVSEGKRARVVKGKKPQLLP